MSSFTIIVDSKNVEGRIQSLAHLLGNHAGGSSSPDHIKYNFDKGSAVFNPADLSKPKTALEIGHKLSGDTKFFVDFVGALRAIFPEMQFKSEFLDRFNECSQHYEFVHCRGFVTISGDGVLGQDVEFFLTNSKREDEVVIAEDSLNRTRRQAVFAKTWETISVFVEQVLEPSFIGGKMKLSEEFGDVAVPPFTGPPYHGLSEMRRQWFTLPIPSVIYSQQWSPPRNDYPNKSWTVTKAKKTYADIHHAFAILLERAQEYIRFNCVFCLPEHRGRINQISVEPKQKGYEIVVKCASTVPLKIRVSCIRELGVPKAFEADALDSNTFPIDYFPTEVKAEILAPPDLVDRLIHYTKTGDITTSAASKPPGVVITTQIALQVQNQVLADAMIMIGAYARFFIMENTLRAVVKDKFIKAFGSQWLQNLTPILLSGKSLPEQTRINQALKDNPDQILDHAYYHDLNNIIDKSWNLFQTIFQDKDRTLLKLKELEDLRNDIAHNRVLPDYDIKRIEVYYMDLLSKV
jgi:hypothetical protein